MRIKQLRFAYTAGKEPDNEQIYSNPLDMLVCAIAKRAVDDYIDLIEKGRVMYYHEVSSKNPVNLTEIRQFFCGGLFEAYTGMDGVRFLDRLNEEILISHGAKMERAL